MPMAVAKCVFPVPGSPKKRIGSALAM
jgi:hypothetical protein